MTRAPSPGEPSASRTNGAPSEADYILGTRDEEIARLGFQHRVWAEHTHRSWRRAGFGYGSRILDLGCGPGLTTVDLAHLVGPEGRVVGFDASEKHLRIVEQRAAAAGLDNVETRQGDALDLSLPADSFDGIYARWLLCFLPDPAAVIAQAARCLAPGGRLLVTDYFNYRSITLVPRSPAFQRAVEAVDACWRSQGGDMDIQLRVPGLMADAGLRVASLDAGHPIARPGTPLWNWPRRFFRGFLPELEARGFLGAEDRAAFWREWDERERDPNAFLSAPIIADVIGVRDGDGT